MTTDPNKKSMRTFQCRDVLWESFEQLARDLECSVDYLVNESMKNYLRQRQQGPRTPFPGSGANPTANHATGENLVPQVTGAFRSNASAVPALRPARPVAPSAAGAPPAPVGVGGSGSVPPRAGMPGAPPAPPAPIGRIFPRMPPPSGVLAPPAIPRTVAVSSAPPPLAPPALPPSHGSAPVLFVYYAGQTFAVTKDRFIIGRGKHATDLRLPDPNVSRQHAMVELTAEGAAIVDLDSTNGVEFKGVRVKRHLISSGDQFILCGHELRFEYQTT